MLDIQSMILAQRVMVLKRFTNKDNNSSWKITLNYFLANLSPIPHFRLMSVVDAIPRDWRRIIRQSAQHPLSHTDDIIYLKLENSDVMLAKSRPNRFITRLKAKSISLQLRKKSSMKNFHSFRLTGRKYTPCLLPSQLKLKLENSNIKY